MHGLINAGLFSSSLALVISSLIYVINNFNTREIERRLMSNFQKIRYGLSLSLICALTFAVFIFLSENINSDSIEYVLSVGAFVLSLSIMIAVLLITELCFIFILRKQKYNIKLKDGTDWVIIKTTNRGLLLKKGDEYKIINDYFDMPIRKG